MEEKYEKVLLHTHLFVVYDPYEITYGQDQTLKLRDIKINIGTIESPSYGTFSVPAKDVSIKEYESDPWKMPVLEVELQKSRMYKVRFESVLFEKDFKDEIKISGEGLSTFANVNDIDHTQDRYRYRQQNRGQEKELLDMPSIDPSHAETIKKRNHLKYSCTIVPASLVKAEREIPVTLKSGESKMLKVRSTMFNIGSVKDALWVSLPIAADMLEAVPGSVDKKGNPGAYRVSLLRNKEYEVRPFRYKEDRSIEEIAARKMTGKELADINQKNRNEFKYQRMNESGRLNPQAKEMMKKSDTTTLNGRINALQADASGYQSKSSVQKSYESMMLV